MNALAGIISCQVMHHLPFKRFTIIVDDNFRPVAWHHQRRLFIRALTCKTTKTHRGVAGGASSDDQVSPVFVRGEERERERGRESSEDHESPLIIFILHFYTPMCYMSVLPLSRTRLHVDVLYLL